MKAEFLLRQHSWQGIPSGPTLIEPWYPRWLARNEKNSAFWMNWEIKHNWGSGGSTVSPSVGSVGDQGAKALKNLQYLD